MLFGERGANGAEQGVAVGEDADDASAPGDLLIEPLFIQISLGHAVNSNRPARRVGGALKARPGKYEPWRSSGTARSNDPARVSNWRCR